MIARLPHRESVDVHSPTHRRWFSDLSSRWLSICVGLLVVALVVELRHRWVPLGDNALTQIWTDEVGGHGTPLVGGDARFGWNHLGPWVFYLLAIPYRLFGRSSRGLLIGAAAINLVCLVAVARCLRATISDRAAAIITAGALLSVLTAPGARLVDPWNPYIALMPFLLAVVSCLAVCRQQWRWLPWLIGAGSLSVQSHIAFGPPVAVLFIVAFGAVVRSSWSQTRAALSRTAIVAFFAWWPPIIEMFSSHGGNALHVWRFFTSDNAGGDTKWRVGLGVVLRESGLSASWLGSRPGLTYPRQAFDGGLGLVPGAGLMALTAAGVWAWRRRNTSLCTLAALIGVLMVAGVLEMASTRGDLYPYLFGWVSIAGMLCWVTLLATIVELGRLPRCTEATRGGVMLVSSILMIRAVGAPYPMSPVERPEDAAIVTRLAAQTMAHLDRSGRYLLDHGTDSFNSIYEHGLLLQLIQHGFDIEVPPNLAVLFGRAMVNEQTTNDIGLSVIAPFKTLPADSTLLALEDPLSAADRQAEIDLTTVLDAAYRAEGHFDAADLVEHAQDATVELVSLLDPNMERQPLIHRLAVLRSRGRPVAVVEKTHVVISP